MGQRGGEAKEKITVNLDEMRQAFFAGGQAPVRWHHDHARSRAAPTSSISRSLADIMLADIVTALAGRLGDVAGGVATASLANIMMGKAMKIFHYLFGRRDRQISDRPSVRGPLIVVNVNFFGLDAARWFFGFLRRRRRAPAIEAARRISTQSSFIGGGRARALAELDARIEPSEPSGFDHPGALVEDAPRRIEVGHVDRARRGRK
jgi:hypothetical protein